MNWYRNFVLLLSLFFFAPILFAEAQVPGAPCTHYASPTGVSTNNGLSQSSPLRPQDFWRVATPGKVLCLMDGEYKGAAYMLAPSQQGQTGGNPSGLPGNPITIRALNDGKARINGEGVRVPVILDGHSYLVLEGFNAHNSSGSVIRMADVPPKEMIGNVFRRICAWDAKDSDIPEGQPGATNYHVWSPDDGRDTLFEDICGFGRGRKIMNIYSGAGFHSNNTTVRRAFFSWMGYHSAGPRNVFQTNYGTHTDNTLVENVIVTWSAEAHTIQTDPNNPFSVKEQPWSCCDGQLLGQRDTPLTRIRSYGNLAYIPGWVTKHPRSDAIQWGRGNMDVKDFILFIDPKSPLGNDRSTSFSCTGGEPGEQHCDNQKIDRMTIISGDPTLQIGPTWTIKNLNHCATVGACPSIFTGANAANVCKRYVNGTLTSQPLWPWPMSQRIKEALAIAGYKPLQGTAQTVDSQIETMFGSIPSVCKTSSTTPPPPSSLSGDLNSDGKVNASDLQLEVNVILGTETNSTIRSRADLNGDGAVNALDLQRLVNIVLGI